MRGRADDAGPNEPIYQPSDLVEDVLDLLEQSGCPAAVNDQVVKLIEAREFSPGGPRYEPPRE